MAKKFTVQNTEELERMIEYYDVDLSIAIVEAILSNYKKMKKYIHVAEIHIIEEEDIADLSVERIDILDTLEKNLKILEANEKYELCSKVVKLINEIK